MLPKPGARLRSSVFTAQLRGTVDRVAATPTAHSFYGDSFALVAFDHGLTMWAPTRFLRPAPKDLYEGMRCDPLGAWRWVAASRERTLQTLAGICSAYTHVCNDHRVAGLWMGVPIPEAAGLVLEMIEPVEAEQQAVVDAGGPQPDPEIPPPAKPYDGGDYKRTSGIRRSYLMMALAGGFTHAMIHRCQGKPLAPQLDPGVVERLCKLNYAAPPQKTVE